MKKLLLLASVLITSATFISSPYGSSINEAPTSKLEQGNGKYDAVIAEAFFNHESNLQVHGRGVVIRLLTDDNKGSRHQRFIIRLSSGQTLLITHNIDLAPRINTLDIGDAVEFYGEYEWNKQGGLIHWTHHDPAGSHVAGWLIHQGQRYQ